MSDCYYDWIMILNGHYWNRDFLTWNGYDNNTEILSLNSYLIRKITVLFYDSLINTEIFTLYGCV